MKNNQKSLQTMFNGVYTHFICNFSDAYLFDFFLKMISEEKVKLTIEIPNFKYIL